MSFFLLLCWQRKHLSKLVVSTVKVIPDMSAEINAKGSDCPSSSICIQNAKSYRYVFKLQGIRSQGLSDQNLIINNVSSFNQILMNCLVPL